VQKTDSLLVETILSYFARSVCLIYFVNKIVKYLPIVIKVDGELDCITYVLPDVTEPGAVNGCLLGPVCCVEYIHCGEDKSMAS
jgi:hypothetical protein